MPRNVGKSGEFGESGNFGKILPIAKVVGEIIRANKLTQLEGRRNIGEFGENGNFGKISPKLLTKWSERIN